jgi:outer membrane usher protein
VIRTQLIRWPKLLITGLSSAMIAATYAADALPDMTLMLEIVLNGKATQRVVPVHYRDGHYYLQVQVLQELGLPLTATEQLPQNSAEVAVDTLSHVHAEYDGEVQQLLLDVPGDWLPDQRFSTSEKKPFEKAYSHFGFLTNYDIYASRSGSKGSDELFSLYSEQRLFGSLGAVTNQGIYQYQSGGDQAKSNRYLRYDTFWRYSDEESMVQYTLGDSPTQALSWSNAVRLGGIQISRNFTMQPNLITYPLPQFAGQAALPSSVDLYINSYKTSQVSVDPGPFTIDTVPYINGAGDATVTVTDALGRQVTTSVPFYVANSLLKRGLVDYSLSVGALRRAYGLKSFDYGQPAIDTGVRYGLTNWLTVEGHFEGVDKLAAGGVGGDLQIGRFGVANGSYSESQADAQAFKEQYEDHLRSDHSDKRRGWQRSFGYSYTHQRFSLNAQRITRSEDYIGLAGYKSHYRLSKQTDQVTASLGLGKLGVIGSGYFDVRQHNGERLRLANISYSISLWRNIHVYSAVNREIGHSGYSGQLMLNIPLNALSNVTFNASRSRERDWLYTGAYTRTAPYEGGLGWDLTYSDGDKRHEAYKQAGLTARTPYTEAQIGVYGQSHYTYWGGLSGSLIFMDGGFYASNMVNDAFALVSTDGHADVPVLFENQLVGKTDRSGHLLISSVPSYYPANYQIDPLSLPVDIQLNDVQRQAVIKSGSGYVVHFPMNKLLAVNTRLLDEQGTPMPVGSAVRLNDGTDFAYVGWDGQLYLEQIKHTNAIVVVNADTKRECRAAFSLRQKAGVYTIAPLICREDNDEKRSGSF